MSCIKRKLIYILLVMIEYGVRFLLYKYVLICAVNNKITV